MDDYILNTSDREEVASHGPNAGFDIQGTIDILLEDIGLRSQNAKVTFMHRYIYQEDDPSVLVAIAKKVVRKLAIMRVLEGNQSIRIDHNALAGAQDKYDNGDTKFYQNKNPR